MIHRLIVKYDKSDWLKNTERVLCACSEIGSGQRSRFLAQTRRIAASGDENDGMGRRSIGRLFRVFSIDECTVRTARGLDAITRWKKQGGGGREAKVEVEGCCIYMSYNDMANMILYVLFIFMHAETGHFKPHRILEKNFQFQSHTTVKEKLH